MCGELDSRTLEVSELRTRDGSESWTYQALKSSNSWRLKVMNLRSHELQESLTFENILENEFGNHGAWRLPEWEHSRTSKKQSQSSRLKKSRFNVWTSGRLVNVWDVKDICVCSH
jgi:hypothetical protein